MPKNFVKFKQLMKCYLMMIREVNMIDSEWMESEKMLRQPDGSDIFDIFFGGGRRRNGPPRRRKGKDTIYTLKVTLNDLYNGKKQKIAIHRKVIVGEADTCKHCNGSGIIRQRRVFGPGMIQEIQSPCHHCGGHGKNYKFNNEKTTVDINILPGVQAKLKSVVKD